MILKGKPVPTLSHLHPEYRKAVLQSATALSKYTGTAFLSFALHLLWISLKDIAENVTRVISARMDFKCMRS